MKQEDSTEIKLRVEGLLSSHEMADMVSRYIELQNRLDTNKKRIDFFNSIEHLRKSIFLEGESLVKKQNCKQCPLETF